MMELSSEDLIVVVAEREFLVNRKALIENNSYFRALLEGSFREAGTDRVELKGICDADAFEVVLDCMSNKRINLKNLSRKFSSVLALFDMLNFDTCPENLKNEIFQNWKELENADSVLYLAETLHFRNSLLSHIFSDLLSIFIENGRSLCLRMEDSQKTEDCCASVLHGSPDLIVDLFGTVEAASFCFSDFDDVNYYYVKGVISWVLDKKLNQMKIRKVVRCLGIQCLNERDLLEFIAKQESSEQRFILEREVNHCIQDTKLILSQSVLNVCAGWKYQIMEYYNFNFQNWMWDLVEIDMSHVEDQNVRTPNSDDELQLKVVNYYPERENFSVQSCCDEAGTFVSVYTSAQDTSVVNHTLHIYELNYGETTFSIVFSLEIPEKVTGCHLQRLDDVLHGFVSYTLDDLSFAVSHFCLQRDNENNTWIQSEFRLDPLLTDLRRKLTPVATSSSKKGILVTFRHGEEYIWLAEYNLKSECLEPLAHIPMPHKQGRKAMRMLGAFPFPIQFTWKDIICTFNLACCRDPLKPLFHVMSTSHITEDHVICPYSSLGFCSGNADHALKLASMINLCFPLRPTCTLRLL